MKSILFSLIILCPLISIAQAQNKTKTELPQDWQKTAFQRFKAKAINLSGNLSTKGAKGFTYTKGPLKNKTAGEAEEWCINTWSKMALRSKKKYYQPSVTKTPTAAPKGTPVILKVGQSFNINGTRGTVGDIKVIDAETLRITLNMTSHTGASRQVYDIKLK